MKLFSFKKGGIHPREDKLSADGIIVEAPLPRKVSVFLSQSIGSPATACVVKNDMVRRGQIIGKADGLVSANVHAPISGTVTEIVMTARPDGTMSKSVTIAASDTDHFTDIQSIADTTPVRSIKEAESLTPEEIISKIREAGIVGLGGAAFPTHVKLVPPKGMTLDTLIVNGAECEPYLTCDDAIMRLQANDIVDGIHLVMKAAKVERAFIGIENNKPEAIKSMTVASRRHDGIEVRVCRTRYPQGSEKQLIKALTGREVPSGSIPASVGVIVDNVATVLAVYHAVIWNIPLIERVMTISGKKLARPMNVRALVGTPLHVLADMAGGIPDDTGKIVIGGPMMGKAAVTLETPLVKATSGVVFFDEKESRRRDVMPCVRCGRCVEVCPMGLEPYMLSIYGARGEAGLAKVSHLTDCIECGSCTWACPSSRPLLDNIRLAKQLLKKTTKQ